MPPRKKKAAGVSITCPGLDGPCPQCAGLSVEIHRPKQDPTTQPAKPKKPAKLRTK